MSEDDFVADYCRWAKEYGYHQRKSKVLSIYQLAENGITTLSRSPSTKMLTAEAIRILDEVNCTLDTILSEMQAIAASLPEYEVVRSMNGVGEVLAPRLIAEIGDIRRIYNANALIAYAGIDSPPFQSGGFSSTKRSISKRGSAQFRKTGYEVMKCLKATKSTEDSAVFDFIMKKEAEGKPKKVAKIARLNKFLRIYYARVKEVC